RATVLRQLKVKPLCAAVGVTADFDPKPTLTKGEVEGVELGGAPISVCVCSMTSSRRFQPFTRTRSIGKVRPTTAARRDRQERTFDRPDCCKVIGASSSARCDPAARWL